MTPSAHADDRVPQAELSHVDLHVWSAWGQGEPGYTVSIEGDGSARFSQVIMLPLAGDGSCPPAAPDPRGRVAGRDLERLARELVGLEIMEVENPPERLDVGGTCLRLVLNDEQRSIYGSSSVAFATAFGLIHRLAASIDWDPPVWQAPESWRKLRPGVYPDPREVAAASARQMAAAAARARGAAAAAASVVDTPRAGDSTASAAGDEAVRRMPDQRTRDAAQLLEPASRAAADVLHRKRGVPSSSEGWLGRLWHGVVMALAGLAVLVYGVGWIIMVVLGLLAMFTWFLRLWGWY